ncbi:MAG: tRNA dihydrouridine synthase DusB [Spirochaetes bacterium GWC1_27_15]|nr:MAG: tRNA dihydrouridine synthase DusB [Spirochaetes bacterium GWB1_27_13]OHD26445.1 MAG: tRNA dihydrouridine synthase DusB [Spirochaetes bacterium GWC1_27_15]
MYLKPIKIGSLQLKSNIFIAPLAGYTNLPTRLLYRTQGAAIAYAEMISAEGLNYSFNKSVKLLDSYSYDEPLGVQLFGANAQRILLAFLKIKDFKFDLVDINCGCSVKKIIKSDSGASLLRKPEEIYKIISILKQNTDKPVTLKIRSGWDNQSINFMEIFDSALQAGANLITLHPRTKSMLFGGKANWEHIKILKQKSSIPVIGNGDIFTAGDAKKMFDETNCDGIMLARGLINNPFLVEEIIAILEGKTYIQPCLEQRIQVLLTHCKGLVDYIGEQKGIIEFRKYFAGYLKGFPEVKRLREKLNQILSYKELESAIIEYEKFRKNNF